MKKIIIIIGVLLILVSCASRNVNSSKATTKKDSIVETKVTVASTETNNKVDATKIDTVIDDDEITITPIDTSKEISINGKKYKNVVLKIKKRKATTSYTNKKTESNIKHKDSVANVKAKSSEESKTNNKEIKKGSNYCLIIWLLILILILYLLWQNRRRIFSML